MRFFRQSWRIAAVPVALCVVSPAFADDASVPPPGNPPAVHMLGPNQAMAPKDAAASGIAARWREGHERPVTGPDGTVVWTYGESLPSITCAPLYSCDLALQPGEVIINSMTGDSVRWHMTPALSGNGDSKVSHIAIKPGPDATVTDLQVYTNRRVYSIKLIFNQTRWTPKTSFSFPDDPSQSNAAWEQYHAAAGTGQSYGSGVKASNLTFYEISGATPTWRPLHVYSDGAKTYIEFPRSLPFGEAPAILGLADDSGFFHGASERTMTYRALPNSTTWMVDGVQNHLKLVTGVGGSQVQVTAERPH